MVKPSAYNIWGGGLLFLQHESFGERNGFTISQSVDQLGFAEDSFTGLDVAGTINGDSETICGDPENICGDIVIGQGALLNLVQSTAGEFTSNITGSCEDLVDIRAPTRSFGSTNCDENDGRSADGFGKL